MAAAKRRSPAKAGGPLKSPLKRMQGGGASKQAGKKRGREAAAAAAAELQVGLGRTTERADFTTAPSQLHLLKLKCRWAAGGSFPPTDSWRFMPLPALPACPSPLHQEEEEALAVIPAADVLEGEPLAPEVEAEAAAEAVRSGRLEQESELQLGLEEDGQVGTAVSVKVGDRLGGDRQLNGRTSVPPACCMARAWLLAPTQPHPSLHLMLAGAAGCSGRY